MNVDLDRLTKQEAYEAGLAEARALVPVQEATVVGPTLPRRSRRPSRCARAGNASNSG